MNLHTFDTSKDLEQNLAEQIAQKLEESILSGGKANLLVSGGKSPKGLFQLLSEKKLDWSKVNIGLVDERFVPTNNEASNEKMIRENLLINQASKAEFIGMVHNLSDEKDNLIQVNQKYTPFFEHITVCVLGMGEDGHTASLFPNDLSSKNDLENSKIGIISTFSPSKPTNRISCSKALICISQSIFLMIVGSSKLEVLKNASEKKLPISHFFGAENGTLEIYYANK